MESKLKLLMELRPCFYGFAGIPQETRLLFSYFLHLPNVDSTGLLDAHVGSKALTKTSMNSHKLINETSSFIISTQESKKLSLPEKVKAALYLWQIAVKNILGFSIPMGHFNPKGFEDFIWEQYFAKTLTTEEFATVTNALFRSLHLSRYTLRMLRCGTLYPKLDTKDYDVFLTQTPFPGRVAPRTQLVVRYHDAVPLFTPHLINNPIAHQKTHYKELCANAKKALFVCTSHAVRNDLLHIFPSLEKRTSVIHDTISPNYFEEKTDINHLAQLIQNYSYESRRALAPQDENDEAYYQRYLYQEPLQYILMVSTLEPRKNHSRLIRAWESLCIKLKLKLKLVLVGELGWQVEPILAAMKPWQQRGQLFHLQKVPVESLRRLYQGAACVVCPSVKEGFDLSGVEAMACGAKVVASDIFVHREVYGEAALYFDPYSSEDQADRIESVVKPNSTMARLLRERGLEQAKQYQRLAVQPQWEQFFEGIREKARRNCLPR